MRPREFINQYEWTFAKTMPWCPHWYVVRRNVDNDKFVGFVKLIRAEGEIRPWGRYRHTYLDIDGYQYWTMGAPIANTIIINRSKLGEPQGMPVRIRAGGVRSNWRPYRDPKLGLKAINGRMRRPNGLKARRYLMIITGLPLVPLIFFAGTGIAGARKLKDGCLYPTGSG
jgi:hypothetical protein